MNVAMFVVWMLVGCVFAIPYTLLSGGDLYGFYVTMMVSPAVAFFFYVTSVTYATATRRPLWKTGIFWFILIWACMPIVFNLTSIVLGHCGFSTASEFFFETRHLTLGAPFLVAIVVYVFILIAQGIAGIARKFRSNGQPNA